MLTPPPVKYTRRRGRRRTEAAATSPPPPVLPLVRVAAVYSDAPRFVRLTIGRAIDIAGLDGSQVIVDDGNWGVRYVATGAATMFDPQTVDIELEELDVFAGADVHLTATAASGIVAVDDGGTWAGVVNLL